MVLFHSAVVSGHAGPITQLVRHAGFLAITSHTPMLAVTQRYGSQLDKHVQILHVVQISLGRNVMLEIRVIRRDIGQEWTNMHGWHRL